MLYKFFELNIELIYLIHFNLNKNAISVVMTSNSISD